MSIPMSTINWIGGQGARAIAALVVIGICFPWLGEVLKQFVTEAIFLLLCISFMRVDIFALREHLRNPGLIIAATAWTTLVVPLVVGACCLIAQLEVRSPDLFLALMLQAVASPMMAAPALAAIVGLDSTLVLITLVTSTIAAPLTAPLYAYLFLENILTLSPLGMGLKLAAILGGSMCVAAAIRHAFGEQAITRHKRTIDGVNVLVLLVFVAAVMGGVPDEFGKAPAMVAGLSALAFVVFFALIATTTLAFSRYGNGVAVALALMVSQRNMGLMLAATNGALPDLAWLYFALCQFPIYLSPLLLKPIVARTVLAVRSPAFGVKETASSVGAPDRSDTPSLHLQERSERSDEGNSDIDNQRKPDSRLPRCSNS